MVQINEQEVVQLIARDRLEIPLSSLYQKVKRVKGKDAKGLAALLPQGEEFETERVFAYVDKENIQKARGMKEAVAEFKKQYQRHGEILQAMIDEKREIAEEHLYFGVQQGKRLTTDDYIEVMQTLGLSEGTARSLYPELLKVSRKLEKAREEDRRIIVGKYETEEE